jgi:hypothetical protein
MSWTGSWWQKRSRLDDDEVPVQRSHVEPEPVGLARYLPELAEEVLGAMSAARRQPPPEAEGVAGSDRSGHVRVTVGQGGILACSVDPRWASRHEGDAITSALMQALQAAKAASLADVERSGRVQLGALAGDALATLRSVTGETGESR